MSAIRNISVVVLLVASCSMAADGRRAQRSAEKRATTDPVSALRQPVPPVVIHEAVFGGPATIERVVALDTHGNVLRESSVPLEAVGTGLVLGADMLARTVNSGDPVWEGETIIGGVVENAGNTPAHLMLKGDRRITLGPRERLYVGDAERLLRYPQQRYASSVDVSAADGGSGPEPIGGGTHCYVCECTCAYPDGSCTMRIDSSQSENCSIHEGVSCECSTESGPKSGTSETCVKRLVPCPPAA